MMMGLNMPRLSLLGLVLWALTGCGGGDAGSNTHIETLNVTPSAPQLLARQVQVYLPSDYERNLTPRPVLYLHDGQGDFSANNGWRTDQAVEDSLQTGGPTGIIIVAINNTSNRDFEYVPWDWYDPLQHQQKRGDGELYVQWIRTELKPYIDSHYRTQSDAAHTGIGGSSLGGLISFYAGLRYPQTFGKVLGSVDVSCALPLALSLA